jgi:hypothetical protein
LRNAKPVRDAVFVSVVSLGQVADTIEGMRTSERNHWRRLLQEGRRELEETGSLIAVDMAVIDTWQTDLRGAHLDDIEGASEELG